MLNNVLGHYLTGTMLVTSVMFLMFNGFDIVQPLCDISSDVDAGSNPFEPERSELNIHADQFSVLFPVDHLPVRNGGGFIFPLCQAAFHIGQFAGWPDIL
ncbi:hypothetical protein [Mucilaginibacter sp.]|uniref:hypothetical protein n=1 Tax=Mucilaginibacter sp. TaxID=1882438 RepID=UPI003267C8BD